MEEGGKEKQAEYQRKYVQKNPLMAKLSQKRKELAVMQKRKENPEYDAEVRRREADKKQKQRLRRKSGMKENELVSEADINIKVETEEQQNEPESDENIFITPSRVRRRSGSLENTRPSVLAKLTTLQVQK